MTVSPLLSIKSPLGVRGYIVFNMQAWIQMYKSWLCHLPAVWTYINYLTFLSLYSHLWNGIILSASQHSRETKWGNPYSMINMVPDTQQAFNESFFSPLSCVGVRGRSVNSHLVKSSYCGGLTYREKKAVHGPETMETDSLQLCLEKVRKCEWQRLS